MEKQKKILKIGGGTGTYTVLSGLRKYFPQVHPVGVVSSADNGGSTGLLRVALGILPPGDIRRALIALAGPEAEEILLKLFEYRFRGAVEEHNMGNLLLAALDEITGGKGVETASKLLHIRGTVLPVTLDNVHLHAQYTDGSIVHGETNIDIPRHDCDAHIERVWLDPPGLLNPKVREAILQADEIVLGPGDLFTSDIPNLLVEGMTEVLRETRAPVVYVVNVMTKYGETHGFQAHDFVVNLSKYLGDGVLTHVLYNTTQPNEKDLGAYREEKAEFVVCDPSRLPNGITAIGCDLLTPGPFIRHDPDKLATALLAIIE